eukprot:gene21388-27185_t
MPAPLKALTFAVLDKIGIQRRSDEGELIRYAIGDENSTITVKITFPSESEIIIYSSPDFKMPESTRQKTMEYINRKNFSSKIGCVEMDIRDGEVRYRNSLRHGEARDLEAVIAALVGLHHTYFARDIY